jgi:hypothetical protein
MSATGQSRRDGTATVASGLAQRADIAGADCYVPNGPILLQKSKIEQPQKISRKSISRHLRSCIGRPR